MVNKYAFSGGQSSLELHRKLGANLDVDVPIKYLEFFLEDDDEFEHIKKEYKDGRMLTGEVNNASLPLYLRWFLDTRELELKSLRRWLMHSWN